MFYPKSVESIPKRSKNSWSSWNWRLHRSKTLNWLEKNWDWNRKPRSNFKLWLANCVQQTEWMTNNCVSLHKNRLRWIAFLCVFIHNVRSGSESILLVKMWKKPLWDAFYFSVVISMCYCSKKKYRSSVPISIDCSIFLTVSLQLNINHNISSTSPIFFFHRWTSFIVLKWTTFRLSDIKSSQCSGYEKNPVSFLSHKIANVPYACA